MSEYHFSIITPGGKLFDDQVEAITAPGLEGSLGVLANHAPIIASLKEGVLTLRKNKTETYFAIRSGVLEVTQNGDTLVLADDAIAVSNLQDAQNQVNDFKRVEK